MELSERTKREMEAGALRSKRNMSAGLVEQLVKEITGGNPKWIRCFDVNLEGSKFEDWYVVFDLGDGATMRESINEFPSDRMKATLMLLGK